MLTNVSDEMVLQPNEKYQLHLVCLLLFARPELKPAGRKLLTLTQQIIWSRRKTAKKNKKKNLCE